MFLNYEGTCYLLCTFDNKAPIHIFDGKVEIRKDFDNMVVMIGVEDEKLLKLKGTSIYAQNFAYHSHHDEGRFPFSVRWHARFGHINYDSFCLLKKNGVSGFLNNCWHKGRPRVQCYNNAPTKTLTTALSKTPTKKMKSHLR
jgi:hypothetical protein